MSRKQPLSLKPKKFFPEVTLARGALLGAIPLLAGCVTLEPKRSVLADAARNDADQQEGQDAERIPADGRLGEIEGTGKLIALGEPREFVGNESLLLKASDSYLSIAGQQSNSANQGQTGENSAVPSTPVTPAPPAVTPPTLPSGGGGGGGGSGGGGGGGGSASTGGGAAPTTSIQGYAINSYLTNALVFQDKNNDYFLDLNEKVALTDQFGRFELLGATPGQGQIVVRSVRDADLAELIIAANRLGTAPVLSALEQGTTYRDSITGVTESFRGQFLSDDASEKVYVTPLSTLLAGAKGNGAETEALIRKIFGIAPNTDYLLNEASTPDIKAVLNALSQLYQTSYRYIGVELTQNDLSKILLAELNNALPGAEDLFDAKDISRLLLQPDMISAVFEKAYLDKVGLDLPSDLRTAFRSEYADKVEVFTSVLGRSPLSLVSDSGLYAYDKVTNTVAFDGSVINNSSIYEVVIKQASEDNNGSLVFSGSLDGASLKNSDNFNFLQDGVYELSLKNKESEIYNLRFLKDSVAPGLDSSLINESPLMIDSVNSNLLSTETDLNTNSSRLSATFLASLESQKTPDEQIEYRVYQSDSNATGDWYRFFNFPDLQTSSAVVEGLYTVDFRLVDRAGNVSEPLRYEIFFDNNLPTVLEESITLRNDTGRFDTDFISQTVDLSLYPLGSGEAYLFALDVVAGDDGSSNNWSYERFQVPESDGAYRLRVKAVDRAGNESDIEELFFVLDTTAPQLNADDGDMVGELAESGTSLPYLYLSGRDEVDNYVQYRLSSNGISIANAWEYSIPQNLSAGTYSLELRRVDIAGNVSESSFSTSINYRPLEYRGWSVEELQQNSMQGGFQESQLDIEGANLTHTFQGPYATDDLRLIVNSIQQESLFERLPLQQQTSLQDTTHRTSVRTVLGEDVFVADANTNTHFDIGGIANSEAVSDQIVLGANGKDLAIGIGVGDIFIGGDGIDIAKYDVDNEILGIGFVSEAEKIAYSNYLGLLEPGYDISTTSPVIKIFSRSPGSAETEEGISVVAAEIIQHGAASERTFYFDKNTLMLSDSSDLLFFDGAGVAVNGGGGADTLIGSDSPDYFLTGAGDPFYKGTELLLGNGGNDRLVVYDGGYNTPNLVSVDGGDGNDVIAVTHGTVEVNTGAGDDLLLVAPLKDDLANRIIISATSLSTEDRVHILGLRDGAQSGVVTSYESGVLSVDLTHLYHHYSSTQVAMDSKLTLSLEENLSSSNDEETLLSLLEFVDTSLETYDIVLQT